MNIALKWERSEKSEYGTRARIINDFVMAKYDSVRVGCCVTGAPSCVATYERKKKTELLFIYFLSLNYSAYE